MCYDYTRRSECWRYTAPRCKPCGARGPEPYTQMALPLLPPFLKLLPSCALCFLVSPCQFFLGQGRVDMYVQYYNDMRKKTFETQTSPKGKESTLNKGQISLSPHFPPTSWPLCLPATAQVSAVGRYCTQERAPTWGLTALCVSVRNKRAPSLHCWRVNMWNSLPSEAGLDCKCNHVSKRLISAWLGKQAGWALGVRATTEVKQRRCCCHVHLSILLSSYSYFLSLPSSEPTSRASPCPSTLLSHPNTGIGTWYLVTKL